MPLLGRTVNTATGAWLGAVTVTTAEAEPVAPWLSVTVSRTVQVPAANVCVAVAEAWGPTPVPSPKSNLYEASVPAASDDADPLAVTASGAVPDEGDTVSRATGGWFVVGADAVTTAEAVPVAPWLSVTVSRAVHVPAANVCVAVAPACGPTTVPSPKSNLYEAIDPSASEDAEPLAVTVSGAVPEDGDTVSRATGGWFVVGADAVITAEAVPVAPWLSVTVSRTVHVPAANVCVAVAEACGPTTVPSPKSNLYEAIVPSASDDADPLAVTASGAVPDDGDTVSRATGGWFAAVEPWNSSAPRSANVTGPRPRFGVPGSSTRARPSASVEGQFATPELASSMHGEPARSSKFPFAGSAKSGSAWNVFPSCPLAALYLATLVSIAVPNLIGGRPVEFQNRLSSDWKPDVDVPSMSRSNWLLVSPLSVAMQLWSTVPVELPSASNPSRKFPYATSPMCTFPVAERWSKPWSPFFHDRFWIEMLSFEPDCMCSPVSWLSWNRFPMIRFPGAPNM